MKNRTFSALIMGLWITLLLVLAATGTAAGRDLGQHLPGWKMARFLPLQGRMVLEHDGEMLVVRSGEEIPGLPGAMVKTIGSGGALIEIDQPPEGLDADQEQSRYWLLVKSTRDGKTEVIVIHALPEEGLLPEQSVETQEIPVSKTSPSSVLKSQPENREGNKQ